MYIQIMIIEFLKSYKKQNVRFLYATMMAFCLTKTAADVELSPNYILSFEKNANETQSFDELFADIFEKNVSIDAIKAYKKYLKKRVQASAISTFLPEVSIGMQSLNSSLKSSQAFLRGRYNITGSIIAAYEMSRDKHTLFSIEQGEFVERILKLSNDAIEAAAQYYLSQKYLKIIRKFIAFYEKMSTQTSANKYMRSRADMLRASSSLAARKVDELRYMEIMKNSAMKFKNITGKDPSKIIVLNVGIEDIDQSKLHNIAMKNSYAVKKAYGSYKAARASIAADTMRRSNFNASVGTAMNYRLNRSSPDADMGISMEIFGPGIVTASSNGMQIKSEQKKFKDAVNEAVMRTKSVVSDALFAQTKFKASVEYVNAAYQAYIQQAAIFEVGGSSLDELIKVVDEYIRACNDLYESCVRLLVSKVNYKIEIFGIKSVYKSYAQLKESKHNNKHITTAKSSSTQSTVLSAVGKYNTRLIEKRKLLEKVQKIKHNQKISKVKNTSRDVISNNDIHQRQQLKKQSEKIKLAAKLAKIKEMKKNIK